MKNIYSDYLKRIYEQINEINKISFNLKNIFSIFFIYNKLLYKHKHNNLHSH